MRNAMLGLVLTVTTALVMTADVRGQPATLTATSANSSTNAPPAGAPPGSPAVKKYSVTGTRSFIVNAGESLRNAQLTVIIEQGTQIAGMPPGNYTWVGVYPRSSGTASYSEGEGTSLTAVYVLSNPPPANGLVFRVTTKVDHQDKDGRPAPQIIQHTVSPYLTISPFP